MKSSRGGVAVVAKKNDRVVIFSKDITIERRSGNQRRRGGTKTRKDSPMTVRRKWNKEHELLCGGNSPSSARFKATAMDKVLILNRRVDTLSAYNSSSQMSSSSLTRNCFQSFFSSTIQTT